LIEFDSDYKGTYIPLFAAESEQSARVRGLVCPGQIPVIKVNKGFEQGAQKNLTDMIITQRRKNYNDFLFHFDIFRVRRSGTCNALKRWPECGMRTTNKGLTRCVKPLQFCTSPKLKTPHFLKL